MPKLSKKLERKLAESELPKSPMPFDILCVACGGKGESSRGGKCVPCNGTGKKATK